jgi:hypothetical protein
MKAIVLAISFIGCMTIVNAQLLTAAVIIIGAKILIGKGFIYGAAKGALVRNIASGNGFGIGGGRGRGGHGHGKREAEAAGDFNAVLLEQNQKDVDECAKLLVCALNAKPLNKLDEDEFAIATTFGQADVIDVTLPTILYDVAAHVGRMAGDKQCRTVYPRCNAEVDSIMKEIKKAAYGQ